MEVECCSLSASLSVILPDFCDLPPAVPPLPPGPLHRDNRLRSHPPHFASTASIPTHHLLSRSKCGGLPPYLLPVFSLFHSSPQGPSVRSLKGKLFSACLVEGSTALIFLIEYPFHFPFSSAILIGGTTILHHTSARMCSHSPSNGSRVVRGQSRKSRRLSCCKEWTSNGGEMGISRV